MDNPEEAREVIRSIRARKGVDAPAGDSDVAHELQLALKVISDDLNSKPTHFLLELIQNADDNQYGSGVIPQLSIVYRRDGYLWVGCNELGFTPANVNAICRISASTKKVVNARKGYIGEKGIGFKSVFKVSDSVWIKSGALQFRFDRDEPLGMVAPYWCDFNRNELMEDLTTTFCFRIPGFDHRRVVQKDVLGLEPELLLFLRQLRCINITVQSANGTLEKFHKLERHDETLGNLRLTTLSRGDGRTGHAAQSGTITQQFVVSQHTAVDMPFEAKRSGVKESDMLLAFPVDDNLEPCLQNRRVYNFLPIREYGFPFVLQADFMLTASRESIEQDNAWNKALVAATVDLFAESVKNFNEQNVLKYSWPKYLTSQGQTYDTAFTGFFEILLRSLRGRAVLQSQALTMQRPMDLECVREEFMDGTNPLFSGPRGVESFVHSAYRFSDLLSLSVSQQSPEQFLALFQEYVKTEFDDFRQRSPVWHRRLAAAILTIDIQSVRSLRIIPLRSGRWVAARGNTLFFPSVSEGMTVPNGVEIDLVDDTAAEDSMRRKLFRALGVSSLDEPKVFELILQQHGRKQASVSPWSLEDVVEHAWFLFNSTSRPASYDLRKLLLYPRDGNLRHGNDLYMDNSDTSVTVSKMLGDEGPTVHYLHERYLKKAEDCQVDDPAGHQKLSTKWLDWLQNEVGVRTLPRLAVLGGISPEFESIIKSRLGNHWLLILKDGWHAYYEDLQSPGNERLRAHLASVKVLCTDGKQRPLKDVYLPTMSVLSEPLAKANVPMIDLMNPNDESWRTLGRSLHLRMSPDADLFIRVLERMREGACPFLMDDLRRVYSGLARNFTPATSKAFRTNALVYIAAPKPAKWVKLDVCRWQSPAAIVTLYALEERFKQNQELFLHRLRLGNATAADVIGELKKLSCRHDSIQDIGSLLKLLNQYVEAEVIDTRLLDGLVNANVKILPVRKGNVRELKSFMAQDYFIADEDYPLLVESFEGAVWFLDCAELTSRRPRVLLEKLGCLHRLLSVHLKTHSHAESLEKDAQTTNVLRTKSEYLSRLVDKSRRAEVFYPMSNIEAKLAEVLVIKKYVEVNGKRVYGNDEDGHIVLQSRGNLEVISSKSRASAGQLPLYRIASDLVDALEIHGRYKSLVTEILMTHDPIFLESELERAGHGQAAPHMNAKANQPPTLDIAMHAKKLAASQSKTLTIGSTTKYSKPVQLNGSASYSLHNVGDFLDYDRPRASRRSNGDVSRTVRHTQRARTDGGLSGYDGKARDLDYSSLNMTSVRSIIHEAVGMENEDGAISQRRELVAENELTASPFELQIGYAGEAFVYEFLRSKFLVREDCWTSASRASYGVAPFTEDESEYADFTIDDPHVSEALTEWLVNDVGIEAAAKWSGKRYHLETKTTADRWNVPFDMSNNQMELARKWHSSKEDVMVIIRVYQVMSDAPSFHVYVDPNELSKMRVLNFRAKGGYEVSPV